MPVYLPAPSQLVLEQGTVYMDADDPRIDRGLEALLGVQQFAAIEVGDEEYILAFDVGPGIDRDDVLFSLGILRHAINQKIRQERMEGIFAEARKIQASILPRRVPSYGSFDIAGRSSRWKSVGGDFFDYIPLTDKILGLAIADVSGHGLPAALQVRDIYMGLRMGLARDFKIVRTVERMNNIIHQSTLTSRFVSMFYGELELNGVFIYVNAGHPPPFHLAADGTARELSEGGPVLGPLSDATYERGFVRMKPGRHAGALHRRHRRDHQRRAGRARSSAPSACSRWCAPAAARAPPTSPKPSSLRSRSGAASGRRRTTARSSSCVIPSPRRRRRPAPPPGCAHRAWRDRAPGRPARRAARAARRDGAGRRRCRC